MGANDTLVTSEFDAAPVTLVNSTNTFDKLNVFGSVTGTSITNVVHTATGENFTLNIQTSFGTTTDNIENYS
jgi:hypothetical protein